MDVNEIRYVPVGDSFTLGQGVDVQDSFPSLLTQHLKSEGINIVLAANPAIPNSTTTEVVDKEIQTYESLNPGFSTLLTGLSDLSKFVPINKTRGNLKVIMDRIIAKLPSKERLLVLTVPDVSKTPYCRRFAIFGNISGFINDLNNVIKDEAQQRELNIIDLFDLGKEMGPDKSLILEDGLHPSAKEYKKWEELIFPKALEILKSGK